MSYDFDDGFLKFAVFQVANAALGLIAKLRNRARVLSVGPTCGKRKPRDDLSGKSHR
jgi:hypothetical protein